MAAQAANKNETVKSQLSGISNLFKVQEATGEIAKMIDIADIEPFKNHPFSVNDDEEMEELVSSIAKNGVLTPIIVRPINGGKFEVISGHRRLHASKILEFTQIPAIIRQMDIDTATILMVDSNLQREHIKPSEKAFAYKMKLEAVKKLSSPGRYGEKKGRSLEIVANSSSDNARQIARYIRLTHCTPDVLELVDTGKLNKTLASQDVSYLSENLQHILVEYLNVHGAVSSADTQIMLEFDPDATRTEVFEALQNRKQVAVPSKITFPATAFSSYFPKEYTVSQMQSIIIKLLEKWKEANDSE